MQYQILQKRTILISGHTIDVSGMLVVDVKHTKKWLHVANTDIVCTCHTNHSNRKSTEYLLYISKNKFELAANCPVSHGNRDKCVNNYGILSDGLKNDRDGNKTIIYFSLSLTSK